MTEVRGNVIVGQSGGPTAVINSSLAGCLRQPRTGEPGRYTACFMASRACCRSGMWIWRSTSSLIWILSFEENALRVSGFLPFQAAGDM